MKDDEPTMFDPVVERWLARAKLMFFATLVIVVAAVLFADALTAAMSPLIASLKIIK